MTQSRLCAASLSILWLCFLSASSLAQYPPQHRVQRTGGVVSKNFVVYAPDARLAQRVSQEAERFRDELAVLWLGKRLPDWQQKCPIQVEIQRDAGGETSFAFIPTDPSGKGVPTDWEMKIFGPPDRLLDAVLPHEITHTIFATHFGRPLPRWADEGACTTVEHVAERKKNHRMLVNFLSSTPPRGIPFNQMFAMKQYPHDILPIYAQGYSLAKFLIEQNGRRHFVDYVERGMQYEQGRQAIPAWEAATREFYGYSNLSDLQLGWNAWVRDGSDLTKVSQFSGQALAAKLAQNVNASTNRTAPTAVEIPISQQSSTYAKNAANGVEMIQPRFGTLQGSEPAAGASKSGENWYLQQMKPTHRPVQRSSRASGTSEIR